MRDKFRHYYPPTDDELAHIWEEATIVLDTNTLLNFFRYTPGTRDEFLKVLQTIQQPLWLPHHVGLEFHRRRRDVVSTISDAFVKVTTVLDTAKNDIHRKLNEYKHHPSLDRKVIAEVIDTFFSELKGRLADQKAVHEKQVAPFGEVDQTFETITELFDGRVGPGLSEEKMATVIQEGKVRYEEGIPPGYKDAKANSNQYGDLIIWYEILEQGRERRGPTIFVTDDAKEDWWWIHNGKTLGPRVELVREYWEHTQSRIHFYQPLMFLEYAKSHIDTEISSASLTEIGRVSEIAGRRMAELRDKRNSLASKAGRLSSQISHHPSHHRAHWRHDLEILERREIALNRSIDVLRATLGRSPQFEPESGGGSDKIERFKETVENSGRLMELEAALEQVQRSRDVIERRAQHGGLGRQLFTQGLEEELIDTHYEIEQIDLALDELDQEQNSGALSRHHPRTPK